jgi:hypothetical protein
VRRISHCIAVSAAVGLSALGAWAEPLVSPWTPAPPPPPTVQKGPPPAEWIFRSVGLMNLTHDALPWLTLDEYRSRHRTCAQWALVVGANYLEQASFLGQKPTLEELAPFYRVTAELAEENRMNVYYRPKPAEALIERIVDSDGKAFTNACNQYFGELKRLWVDLCPGMLRDGDIISTFAEGDSSFTNKKLGWGKGTKKYQQYVRLACGFVDELRRATKLRLLYTESVCGGEARIRDQFTPEIARRLDFISTDWYAGIGGPDESPERMEREAKQLVEYIRKYSAIMGTKIALGEWSSHWDVPKSKAAQRQYLEILIKHLETLPPEIFPGMEYFHFALPQYVLEFDKATTYYSSPLVDKTGTFPAFITLMEAYHRHGGK